MVTDGYWYFQLTQVLSSLRCQKPRSGCSRSVAKSSSGMLSGFRSLVDSTITCNKRDRHNQGGQLPGARKGLWKEARGEA